jgi:hypothetical protein
MCQLYARYFVYVFEIVLEQSAELEENESNLSAA